MAKAPKHPGRILQDQYLSDLGMNGNALAGRAQSFGRLISTVLRRRQRPRRSTPISQ